MRNIVTASVFKKVLRKRSTLWFFHSQVGLVMDNLDISHHLATENKY
uniref:Uncharacterized protein n=1 Tax=Anguilla anguilla TaxID=7936 RepID=A0A0E9WLQ7_ANGAN